MNKYCVLVHFIEKLVQITSFVHKHCQIEAFYR